MIFWFETYKQKSIYNKFKNWTSFKMEETSKKLASNSDFEFVFDGDSSDLLFLKHFEILSVLKGDLHPIMEFIENATYSEVKEN